MMTFDYQTLIPTGQANLTLHNIVSGNTTYLPTLETILTDLMPQYAHYIPRIRKVAANAPDFETGFVQHQWLCLVDGEPAGIIIFKYVAQRACGLGLDFAIIPQYRHYQWGGQRLAYILLQLCLHQLQLDAEKHGRKPSLGLLVEVEPTGKLVAQYQRYGFLTLPINYHEPPFIIHTPTDHGRLTDEAFLPMKLGIFPSQPANHYQDAAVLKALIYAFLIDHYGMIDTHWSVQQAIQSIPNP